MLTSLLRIGRTVNPQLPLAMARVRETETKVIVLYSGHPDVIKTWAVQCQSPILFDCLRLSKEKPMEIENPLEVDPNNRSIMANFANLGKDQLKPVFAYDRIFMPRMGYACSTDFSTCVSQRNDVSLEL